MADGRLENGLRDDVVLWALDLSTKTANDKGLGTMVYTMWQIETRKQKTCSAKCDLIHSALHHNK